MAILGVTIGCSPLQIIQGLEEQRLRSLVLCGGNTFAALICFMAASLGKEFRPESLPPT